MSSNQYRHRNSGRAYNRSRSGKWLRIQFFLFLLFSALVAIWLYLPIDSVLVEKYYSQGIYPYISNVLSSINSVLPVPLTLVTLLIVVVVALYNLVRAIGNGRFWRWFVGSLLTLSIICLWFILAWGANYKRLTVSELLDLNSVQVSNQERELEQLATYLVDVIERDADSQRLNNPDAISDAIQANSQAMEAFLKKNGINTLNLTEQVKYWPKGILLKGFSASGIMLPWFVEPTIDAGLADADSIGIAAHELAHAAGFATEGDADFIGTLAGLSATNPLSRYSAALRSYQAISVDLSSELKTVLDARLPAIAKSDWNETYNAYLKYQAPNWLRQRNQDIYDSYLQSQGVEAGIQDYGRSTELLLQAMKKGLLPEE